MMRLPALIPLACLASLVAGVAHAACPQALAVYTEIDGDGTIEFSEEFAGFAVTNNFRLILSDDLVLDGIVMWNQGFSRPNGMIMHQCPEGDVTGEELDACTYWQGVIYTVSGDGVIDLIGQDDAAETVLLPDLSRALHYSDLNRGDGVLPGFDAFRLSGCQQ